MARPLLKVCGVRDAAFAARAARLGVDYIGVIFAAKSPRRVSEDEARAVAAAARGAAAAGAKPPKVVGVFVETPPQEIARLAESVPLDVAQLHAPYDDAAVAALKAVGLEVWRLSADADDGRHGEDAVLLDGRSGGMSGGTGTLADWSRVAGLKSSGRRVVLAGGISPANAAAAAATGADILDANSSLETSPGAKSPALLLDLLRALGRLPLGG